jgi:phosphatidylserine decarboxylase
MGVYFMKHKEIVAREGWIFVAFFLAATLALFLFTGYWGAVPAIILALFCIYFFRNPERVSVDDAAVIVAPADGRIMDIGPVVEERFIHGPAIRVRIFLSLFNVHINRSPVDAEVVWVQKVAGQFLPAYKPEAGTVNVRNYVGLNARGKKLLLVQITGLVARRLVCWVSPGDSLLRGERFGLIRFGSCTELYLPTDASVEIQAGDKVKGGETVIARFAE